MALRKEDLYQAPDAVVLDFPVRIAQARARRARRARLERGIVAWAVALGLTAMTIAGAALSGPPEVATRAGAPQAVVVEAGETVFELARTYAAEGTDVAAYADEISALNGLQGVVPAGTEVRLP